MPAPKGNKNALGNTGGKSLNDRKLASDVRSLALTEIQKYLEAKEDGYKNRDMKQALLLKLAPSLLPRLNEHTGEDGGNIKHELGVPEPIYKAIIEREAKRIKVIGD
jgi:hypothetical protein